MAGGGGAGGGAVGAVGGVGAMSGMSMTAGISGAQGVRSMQAASQVSAPAQSTHVSISSGARAALAAESGHGIQGANASPFAKLKDDLTADLLLAMMNHKKHHHDGIGGALMAAEAIRMYQSVQAMSGAHAMGAATAAVTAPAAAAHA